MLKKSIILGVVSAVVMTTSAFAAKRTDCPADNMLPLGEGEICCCHTPEGEASNYYECNPVENCDTSEGSGNISLSGPPACPCSFTKKVK